MPGKYWNPVVTVAVEHGGYVTPALLEPYGVPAVELRKMASRGTLVSAGRGIYRVPALPPDRFDEFILAGLWANGRGVISHDSALVVHELCDINPIRAHLTIPRSYRISRAGGDRYTLHHADLGRDDITRLDGVPVTTIRRTLTDSVDNVPTYLVRQAIATAYGRGAISAADRDALLQRISGEGADPDEHLEQHRDRDATHVDLHTVGEPRVEFTEVPLRRGRAAFVTDRLWRLPISRALADVTLPLGLNWSKPGATFRLSDRRRRARCYEIVLREGAPAHLLQYVDGALLVDLWPELVLPPDLRAAWQPTIDPLLG